MPPDADPRSIPTIALIRGRQSPSPKLLGEPTPSPDDLALMMTAAAAAPDHKRLRPFRFMLIPRHRRQDLATAFEEAKRERDPAASKEELARAGDKAHRGPMVLAVIMRIVRDHPRVSVSDQIITVGAAVQNVLLTAEALGFAACLRSGTSATSRRVRLALGLAADEEIAAFLMIGTIAREMPPSQRHSDGLLTVWD